MSDITILHRAGQDGPAGSFEIPDEWIDEWADRYTGGRRGPIELKVRQLALWCEINPNRRKTKWRIKGWLEMCIAKDIQEGKMGMADRGGYKRLVPDHRG